MKALMIHQPKQRDAALVTACRDAATIGAGEAVVMGVPRIEDKKLRDAAAAECAILLKDNDQGEAALDTANLITDETRRSEVLNKLDPGS